jgi:hypothetical protein
MRGRGQLLAAFVTVLAVVAAGAWLQRDVGTRPPAGPAAASAPSGAWFCPHGGGPGWQRTIEVANPGDHAVGIRVTTLSEKRPTPPRSYEVDPGRELLLPADDAAREASTVVEYFGGWVAASWVTHAGGGETGVAAEPCSPVAGSRWLLPDGSTALDQNAPGPRARRTHDAYIVVMNPFAADAVVSITLYTDRSAPVSPGLWHDVDLKPFRSRAFHLNVQRLGFATVSAVVDASVGRVVTSSLDVSSVSGTRSSIGQRSPVPGEAIFPGGVDEGRTELVVMNPTPDPVQPSGTALGAAEPQPLSGPQGDRVDPVSAQTFPLTTRGPTTLDVGVPAGTAIVRRTYGVSSDSGASGPGVPARAWMLMPAIGGEPSHPGAVLANPGSTDLDVRLAYVPAGHQPPPAPITVHVPAFRTVAVPSAFVEAQPFGAIVATSTDGTFVPAEVSASLGVEGEAAYAVALGVPIPDAWVPNGARAPVS